MDAQHLLALLGRSSPDQVTHADHVTAVFLRTRAAGEDEAVGYARNALRSLAAAAGAPGKYHETMTTAWARAIARATTMSSAGDVDSFLAEHPELMRRDLMTRHYSPAVLHSDEARARFVEPDLLPLP
jgi:hypothetical protein